jgi:hypothetical protein
MRWLMHGGLAPSKEARILTGTEEEWTRIKIDACVSPSTEYFIIGEKRGTTMDRNGRGQLQKKFGRRLFCFVEFHLVAGV